MAVERSDTKSCRINSGCFAYIFKWLVEWSCTGRDFLSNVLTIGVLHPEHGNKTQQTRGLLSLWSFCKLQHRAASLHFFYTYPFLGVHCSCLADKRQSRDWFLFLRSVPLLVIHYSWWHLPE